MKGIFELATREEIAGYLSHRDPKTGKTWHQFCDERGFSFDQMMHGLRMEKAREAARAPAIHAG